MTIIRPAASMACRPQPDISRATDATSAALLYYYYSFYHAFYYNQMPRHGETTLIRKPD